MRSTLLNWMTCGLCWTVAVGFQLGSPPAAHAQAETALSGFHLGLKLPAGRFGATMNKSVDNTDPNTLVPDPRRGMVFSDMVSGDGFAYGLGASAGYRLPLSGGSWFLEGDVGAQWQWGETEARFAGVGVSPERRQLGESWPDRWTLAKDLSYGATLRLGGRAGGSASDGVAVYLLGGVRFAAARFTNHYTGCFSTEPCQPSGFESGMETLDLDFTVWNAGVGLEKPLGERAAIRAEAGYAMYSREEWVTPFDDVVVTVTSDMKASEPGLSLSLVRFF